MHSDSMLCFVCICYLDFQPSLDLRELLLFVYSIGVRCLTKMIWTFLQEPSLTKVYIVGEAACQSFGRPLYNYWAASLSRIKQL